MLRQLPARVSTRQPPSAGPPRRVDGWSGDFLILPDKHPDKQEPRTTPGQLLVHPGLTDPDRGARSAPPFSYRARSAHVPQWVSGVTIRRQRPTPSPALLSRCSSTWPPKPSV